MDMITVDLGAASMDQVGDDVEMWGRRLAIEDVAKTIGTIPYELTIKLTRRVARTFVGQSE
jgi:alanine racemase